MTPRSRLHLPELELAGRRHGVVTRAELVALGLGDEAIRHRVRSGRLHLVHRGVYAVGRPQLSREGRWLAAVLACGDGAALSHGPAALLWGILERGDERPHVTVPTQAGRRTPAGVRLHRAATASPTDVVVRLRIPVTTLSRTLVDLAATAGQDLTRQAVRQAARTYGLDLAALRTAVETPRTACGPARLRRVLDTYVTIGVESELEARFLDLCRRHRLPMPLTQVPIGRHRADFLWPDARLIVETDGRGHDNEVTFADDRVKDRALKAAGFEVLRFTWAEVVHRAAAVAAEVRAARVRRRRELGR